VSLIFSLEIQPSIAPMNSFYYGGWAPYVPVAQRKAQALKKIAALKKKGHVCQPVQIEGRAIAKSFWGKAWCDNLAAYSDYENRLPRGSSYVRNGAVIDLRIAQGQVQAMVSGSEIYHVEINVQPLPNARWKALCQQCSGQIGSLVELLQGKLSKAVMETVIRRPDGLFPQPAELRLKCSCPDGAWVCKHVAATLYGVGARLDHDPALLFDLRGVDPQELMTPGIALPEASTTDNLAGTDLSALFGIDLAAAPAKTDASPTAPVAKKKPKPLTPGKPSAPAAPSPARKAAASRTRRLPIFSASDLLDRGLPRHMIQNWLASGVLLRTDKRGTYQSTAQTESRIVAYLKAHR
jgi:uncharacterized Zn finger protein